MTKKKKRISVQAGKAKGRRLQKWACQKISDLTGVECGRDKPIESRGMGQNGVDVRMESHVLKQFPFSIECKNCESWDIHSFISQAKENALAETNWLLIISKNRQKPLVVLDSDVFMSILNNRGLSLHDFHIDSHAQQNWLLDAWIPRMRENNKDDKWLVRVSRPGDASVYFLDADKFFELYGMPCIQLNNNVKAVKEQTQKQRKIMEYRRTRTVAGVTQKTTQSDYKRTKFPMQSPPVTCKKTEKRNNNSQYKRTKPIMTEKNRARPAYIRTKKPPIRRGAPSGSSNRRITAIFYKRTKTIGDTVRIPPKMYERTRFLLTS